MLTLSFSGVSGVEDRDFLVQFVQNALVFPMEPQTQIIVLTFLLLASSMARLRQYAPFSLSAAAIAYTVLWWKLKLRLLLGCCLLFLFHLLLLALGIVYPRMVCEYRSVRDNADRLLRDLRGFEVVLHHVARPCLENAFRLRDTLQAADSTHQLGKAGAELRFQHHGFQLKQAVQVLERHTGRIAKFSGFGSTPMPETKI